MVLFDNTVILKYSDYVNDVISDTGNSLIKF